MCVCMCVCGWRRLARECTGLSMVVLKHVCVPLCGRMSVCQHVTVCGFMSVAKQEVCGVKVAFRKLDVVHYRQDFTSKRRLETEDKECDANTVSNLMNSATQQIPCQHNTKSPIAWRLLWFKSGDCHFLDQYLKRGHVQRTRCQIVGVLFWQDGHRVANVFLPEWHPAILS